MPGIRTDVARDGDGHILELQVLGEQPAAARGVLAEIEGALRRTADGSYGLRERRVELIASERLEVLHEARPCAPCQNLARPGR